MTAASIIVVLVSAGAARPDVALAKLLADLVFITSVILFIRDKKILYWDWVVIAAVLIHGWVFYAGYSSTSDILFAFIFFIVPPSILGFAVSKKARE